MKGLDKSVASINECPPIHSIATTSETIVWMTIQHTPTKEIFGIAFDTKYYTHNHTHTIETPHENEQVMRMPHGRDINKRKSKFYFLPQLVRAQLTRDRKSVV